MILIGEVCLGLGLFAHVPVVFVHIHTHTHIYRGRDDDAYMGDSATSNDYCNCKEKTVDSPIPLGLFFE